ncbi:MAG: SGNH/GDSL hydrolase family protein [Actinobacteria bacterium]|nr:SGNH/GDSL hydrolase family protein [Actinomycetota bacterium]
MKSIIKNLLRRLYIYIYGYRLSKNIRSDIQRKYTLKNGKGKKSIRYVALGDSLTYGFGASNHQGTFPYILSQKLLNKYKKVETTNLAVCGANIDDLLYKQLPQAIRKKPNFITILIGTNDAHNCANIKRFKEFLENIIDRLKKSTNAQILIINIPYLISAYMTFPPYNLLMDFRIKKFNRFIEELAGKKAVKYFDLYSSTKNYFKKGSQLYSSDWFHPSDKGYILWGNLINLN